MQKYDYLIVGAGFAGAVLAERIASQLDKKVLIIDRRNHVGGNCYDFLNKNSIFIQKYGPHIFHTKNKKVFDYLSKFTKWNNYKHKVIAFYKRKYYPIPINLDTVNRFYNLNLKNEKRLKEFLALKRINIKNIKNSRDVVVSKFGKELYEAFVKYYTKKQWDRFPEELDKSVLARLPIRYDKNDYFFDGKYQGMPLNGFGKLFERMLNHKNITIMLNKDFFKLKNIKYKNLIYTGRIDEFFNYKFGKLDYRCINFTFKTLNKSSYQPNSVVNHTEKAAKFLRVTEFKKFYNKKSKKTVLCKELFGWKGEICYPVFDRKNIKLSEKYKKEAEKLKDIIFIGRLAQYKYFNMDSVVEEALNVFKRMDKQGK